VCTDLVQAVQIGDNTGPKHYDIIIRGHYGAFVDSSTNEGLCLKVAISSDFQTLVNVNHYFKLKYDLIPRPIIRVKDFVAHDNELTYVLKRSSSCYYGRSSRAQDAFSSLCRSICNIIARLWRMTDMEDDKKFLNGHFMMMNDE